MLKLKIILPFFIFIIFYSCSGQNNSEINTINKQNSNIIFGDTVSGTHDSILVIFQDKRGIYWFGSNGHGIYSYDKKHLIQFTNKNGLCNNFIQEIQEDTLGNIYFTTSNGISKFDGKTFTTLQPVKNLPAGNEWKLERNDLWFKGESGKNGPYRYDGKYLYSLEFPKHYLADEYYTNNANFPWSPYEIYFKYKDKKGNMWFGTSNFGICRYDGKSLSWLYEEHLTLTEAGGSFGIRSIIEDKNGKFWFCNSKYRYAISPEIISEKGKALINYKREKGFDAPKNSNSSDRIYFMSAVEDNKGDLWMVTFNNGVYKWDGKTLEKYFVKNDSKDVTLYAIYKDKNGDLFLATHTAGVYKFNEKEFEKLNFLKN